MALLAMMAASRPDSRSTVHDQLQAAIGRAATASSIKGHVPNWLYFAPNTSSTQRAVSTTTTTAGRYNVTRMRLLRLNSFRRSAPAYDPSARKAWPTAYAAEYSSVAIWNATK